MTDADITFLRLRRTELELTVEARRAEIARIEEALRDVNDQLIDALAQKAAPVVVAVQRS